MGLKDKFYTLRNAIKDMEGVKNYALVREYGENIHDVDLREGIQKGVVDRLLNARELGIKYAVVLDGIAPLGSSWDKYGDGTWNPKKGVITTEDIRTPNNDRAQEEKNIYDFLSGRSMVNVENTTMTDENTQGKKARR